MREEDPEVETDHRSTVPNRQLEILPHNAFEVLPRVLSVFSRYPHSDASHVLS